MDAIAEDAGVALKTVYVVFATKSGVLRGLWDLLLKGDLDEAASPSGPGIERCSTRSTLTASCD